jgi:hypothetical protein
MVNSVGPLAVVPHMGAKVPYNVEKDIAPLTLIAVQTNALVVNAALPVKDVKEYVDYVKAHPDKLSYGSSGVAGGGHLAGELFRSYSKVPLSHVPYRGGGPAMNDLLGKPDSGPVLYPARAGGLRVYRKGARPGRDRQQAVCLGAERSHDRRAGLPRLFSTALPGCTRRHAGARPDLPE